VTTVLLHDIGDPAGGAAWRAVAPADWVVPDLPGHGTAPAPPSGHYDPMAAVALARWAIAAAGDDQSTVVGVGEHAHAALVHAVGGDCDRVVIVDGLWGPWRTPAEEIDGVYTLIRAIVADPAATGPPPASGLDPRAGYGYGMITGPRFLQRFWAAVDQQVLAVETPASTTPPGERAERLTWFGGPATLVELDTADPAAVVDAVLGVC
jgi:pimeloyl-ACP methyl ester carboxylesterase